MNKQIYALGVGHNTPVFIDLAEQCGYEILGLYHYNNERTGETDHGFNILGSFDDLFTTNDLTGKRFLLTMGDAQIRKLITDKIVMRGGSVPTIIHPSSVVSRFAEIASTGVIIGAFTHIQADTTIDEGTVILSGVNISHTNHIGKYCFFAGGSTLGAYTTVKDFVFIGQGALTISGKVETIGEGAFVGARALVTKSVNACTIVAGAPAKVIKR